MRICFIAHASSLHTHRWAGYFRDAGHDVSLVSVTPGEGPSGVRTFAFRAPWPPSHERTNWQYLIALPRLWRVVRRIRPDIVNAHFLSSNGVLAALAKPVRCRLVISVHGSDLLVRARRSRLHALAARYALARADLVTSAGESLTGELRAFLPSRKPVFTLQYGVDTEVFHPPETGIDRAPLVLSARALVPRSNVAVIVEALRRLDGESAPLRLEICNDGSRRRDLERETQPLVDAGRVRFAGVLAPTELAARMRSAAIYVSMSETDGTSLTLLEAMACGAFPVTADIPANREWITHGRNGFLVPLGSAERLAEGLKEAWRRPALRAAAAARNREIVRERADYAKNMPAIEARFARLLAGGTP